ncbi:SGNH/GDSL hydrolase family protein [Cytobacillus sp. IB215665]|uniref:SGNH/GDSL hydrolase family protein n=1 Tax=Cytobacillus sp. IB215665 TaxID=3097357 RepID=UPI002A15D420|nr:GDSL-type esterase/lipase family protein [Cytobacillus sp. IB215665]MDX8365697.1 GDSL-type esterase/lipase family protein [Cytobacillus sp. IB215665]
MRIALIGDSLTEGRPGVSFSSILQKRNKDILIDNYGKAGDTVISLNKRLTNTTFPLEYDLTFLWIGINDVYSQLLGVKPQPFAKNHQEFKQYYHQILRILSESSTKIVTVTPSVIGEKLDNDSNKTLEQLSSLIHSISKQYDNVACLDLHSHFKNELDGLNPSNYISTSAIRILVDVLLYKKAVRIDHISSKRGLYLTLDGIHLNSIGATFVAEQYEKMVYTSIQNGIQKADVIN